MSFFDDHAEWFADLWAAAADINAALSGRPSKVQNGGKVMVFDKIKDIIVEQLDVEEDAVTMEASITDDLGAD